LGIGEVGEFEELSVREFESQGVNVAAKPIDLGNRVNGFGCGSQ
jgi:hypothetical protein